MLCMLTNETSHRIFDENIDFNVDSCSVKRMLTEIFGKNFKYLRLFIFELQQNN